MSMPSSQPPSRRHVLHHRVVVIAGASSGIGRATAHAFAKCGARLVLAARNQQALHDVAAECTTIGAHALVVVTDVSDANAVAALARQAVDAFGRIDVWINNAGVGLFGPFENAGIEVHRRVVEINLFGAMNGAAAVLPCFRAQGAGVMITNISLGGFAPVPFAAAYTAAKFALRGFMASLRQELTEYPDIHICSLFPAVIDTPGFEHGANVSDVALSAGGVVFPPQKVATAMVSLARRPQPELPVGWPSRLARVSYGYAPKTTERLIGAVFRHYVRSSPPQPRRLGNLFEPSRGRMSPSGGWKIARRSKRIGPSLALLGLAGVGGAWLLAHSARAQRA